MYPAHRNILNSTPWLYQVNAATFDVLHGERFIFKKLDPNIRLSMLFSNTLSLHSSFNIREHLSQPYSKTNNITLFYILIFKFLREVQKGNVHELSKSLTKNVQIKIN